MSMIGKYLAVKQDELDSLYAQPEQISTFLYEIRYEEIEDIDKAWHAIHFTLTGEQYGGKGYLRFSIEKLKQKEIYPDIWDEGEEAPYYIFVYYEKLRKFYLNAAANNMAVITFIN